MWYVCLREVGIRGVGTVKIPRVSSLAMHWGVCACTLVHAHYHSNVRKIPNKVQIPWKNKSLYLRIHTSVGAFFLN